MAFGVWRAVIASGLCVHSCVRASAQGIETRDATGHWSTNGVRTISEEAVTGNGESCAEQLARFFRAVGPVQIPANVSAKRAGNTQLQESVVVEYCGREHAIFRSALPLEYNDDVWLTARGDARRLNARVVAVQYHEGLKAVAVRFESGPCRWVTTT